jgi:hypothetical protein
VSPPAVFLPCRQHRPGAWGWAGLQAGQAASTAAESAVPGARLSLMSNHQQLHMSLSGVLYADLFVAAATSQQRNAHMSLSHHKALPDDVGRDGGHLHVHERGGSLSPQCLYAGSQVGSLACCLLSCLLSLQLMSCVVGLQYFKTNTGLARGAFTRVGGGCSRRCCGGASHWQQLAKEEADVFAAVRCCRLTCTTTRCGSARPRGAWAWRVRH